MKAVGWAEDGTEFWIGVTSWRLSGWKRFGAQKDSNVLDRLRRELEKLSMFPPPIAGLRTDVAHRVA